MALGRERNCPGTCSDRSSAGWFNPAGDPSSGLTRAGSGQMIYTQTFSYCSSAGWFNPACDPSSGLTRTGSERRVLRATSAPQGGLTQRVIHRVV